MEAASRLGEILPEQRKILPRLGMMRLFLLMFLVLTSKWKVLSETIPSDATKIVGDNVIVIQCVNV